MANFRVFWMLAFIFTSFWIWVEWEKVNNPQVQEMVAQQKEAQARATAEDVPSVARANVAPGADMPAMVAEAQKAQRIHVKTDVLDVELDVTGGDLRHAELIQYPISLDTPDEKIVLMKDTRPGIFYAQSGLLSQQSAPTHKAVYQAAQTDYTMAAGQNELRVPMVWRDGDVEVVKTYVFKRDSYVVDIEYQVNNMSASDWSGATYGQLVRTEPSSEGNAFIYTFTGGVLSTPAEPYEKLDFDDLKEQKLSRDAEGGWIAMIQHYFLGAFLPNQQEVNNYYTKFVDNQYYLGYVAPMQTVKAGEVGTLSTQMFIGPKEQKRLEVAAPNLELTVDYGIFHVFAAPLFWLLEVIHDMVGNWGWAIIFLTILIKLAFYPLSDKGYRSMANMRKLAPRLQQLKESYGDDKAAMSQKMMQMYKEEKINPLGGCLPILIQMPIFIALYWVLLESVEMRQAPFMLWIHDLSVMDPYFVLPILMGVTMYIQQALNPPPMDPMQAKVMKFLPFIFTVFFVFFPAGLVLYWVVNNTLSMAQQYYVLRKVEKGEIK